jgi:cell division protein ZapA (FtsZ GTPase activity inhibitor)
MKNRIAHEIEDAVVALAIQQPTLGQVRVGGRGVWLRHDLQTMNKRLKALEAKMARERILTEAQPGALEKAKTEKEALGEFES